MNQSIGERGNESNFLTHQEVYIAVGVSAVWADWFRLITMFAMNVVSIIGKEKELTTLLVT